MKISDRLLEMPFSPVRKFNYFANIAAENNIKVYHLQIGQPDVPTPSEFFNKTNSFDVPVLKYSDSHGIDELIQSFIKYYKNLNINFEKNDILITNGGSEALYFAMMAVCEEGDNILLPEPFYTNYNSFVMLAGLKKNTFITKAENGFHLPGRQEIVSKINDKTKAILISNPGNPTGVVYRKEEIDMLCGIALEYGLYIITDEVYREFVYDGITYFSPLHDKSIRDRVILIDSISKRYSACGARIGLIASYNTELMAQILKLCQSRLASPTIEQIGAANLINTPVNYFKTINEEYAMRRDVLFNALKGIPGVLCKKPEGAFYIMAKLPIQNSDHFAKWLLTDYSKDNCTVMVAPGDGFYSTPSLGSSEIRISYCLNTADLEHAMNVFESGLTKYKEIFK